LVGLLCFFAIYSDHVDCVELLIEANAKIDEAKTNHYKHTPLMLAAFYGKIKSVELLLNKGKCDPFIKDACGDTALHHAIKLDQYAVVKALVSKKEEHFLEENGLALSPFDCSVLLLIGSFPLHRVSESQDDVTLISERKFIYNHLLKVLSNARILAKTDDVVRVTDVMLESSLAEAKVEKRSRRRRFYDDEEGEPLAQDDMHGHDILSNIIMNFCRIPELPSVADSDGDVEMEEEKEEEKEEAPDNLEGMTIALSGVFKDQTHESLISLIKNHGGNYASSITKAVTHVIASDPTEKNAKLLKAKEEGKKIVGEEFLSNILSKDKQKRKGPKKSKPKAKAKQSESESSGEESD